MGFPIRSLAGLLLLSLFCFSLQAAASDAFSSKEGHRSPKLSSSRNPQAAERQSLHPKEPVSGADAPSSTPTSARWPLGPRPVRVTLFGESRCPFCADWLVKNSQPLIEQIGEIIEFRVVEFGNARRNETTGALSCQHGPSECEANAAFACARAAFSSSYRWLNVVTCSERDVFEHAADPLKAFDACVVEEVRRGGSPFGKEEEEEDEEKGLLGEERESRLGSPDDSDPVGDDGERAGRAAAARLRACASGDEGAALIAEAERETASLRPRHTFVPWVVVDGLPLGDASLEATRAVACAAWRGKREARPEACLAAPGLGQQLPRSIF
jgi:interferon gamma-inducible protein 30